ncbi:MAG TPA: helix-turn-helix transcriptional regulator, partial [Phycisphaerae bacterium]|nr:helix-turn-helix transcriptional regulator [Phycisphaerae bacterium]
ELTQRELARLLDVSDAYVSQLLNGDNTPTLETVEKIARALGTTNFYLLLPVETAEAGGLTMESRISHAQG